jgi:DNA repair protein SbcD/Mre11
MIRLLHTSDWHIGRQLHGASLLADQAHVLEQIIDIAEREAVDAVIIAGDIYDRAIPPADAVSLLSETLSRLCLELGKAVVVIAGNHDSGDRLGFGAGLLQHAGLHIVGSLQAEPAPVTLQGEGMALDIFGIPHAGPLAVTQALEVEVGSHEEAMAAVLAGIGTAVRPDRPAVVVAHCFVDGASECDSERPLSVGGSDRVSASLFEPFAYAALGHLHGRQYQGAEHIRYSGSILKYSFSEVNHRKSVTLVDISPEGRAASRQVELEPLRDLRVLRGSLDELLEQGRSDPQREDYIRAEITNSEAILHVMDKLRAVYPNVLQMENVASRDRESPEARRDILKKGYLTLFDEFFEQVQQTAMSSAQRAHMERLLTELQEEPET